MKQISLAHKQLLESQGIRLYTGNYDAHFKTDLFVQLPDGRTLAAYPDWVSVPYDQLANGDEFTVTVSPNIDYPDSFNYIFDAQAPGGLGNPQLFDPLTWTLFFAAALIFGLGIVLCVMGISLAINAPCGTEPKIESISDCEKVITKPDCSSATFNQCYDEDGDGIYEGKYTSDWSGGTAWITWIVLGVAAVAGIYIIAKVIPALFQKKPQYMQYYPPPQQQYTRAPGIDYVY